MKQITLNINFGGFVGADEEITFDVPNECTDRELDDICQKQFEDYVCENCEWEIIDIAEDEDAN